MTDQSSTGNEPLKINLLLNALKTTTNHKLLEALARSLGNYLFLKAEFTSSGELNSEDMRNILGRWMEDLKIVFPQETVQSTQEDQHSGRGAELRRRVFSGHRPTVNLTDLERSLKDVSTHHIPSGDQTG